MSDGCRKSCDKQEERTRSEVAENWKVMSHPSPTPMLKYVLSLNIATKNVYETEIQPNCLLNLQY